MSELCRELGIRPVTLYLYVDPQGQLREQGRKVLGFLNPKPAPPRGLNVGFRPLPQTTRYRTKLWYLGKVSRTKQDWTAKLRKAKKRHDSYLAARKTAFREGQRARRRAAHRAAGAVGRRDGSIRVPTATRTPARRRRILSLQAPHYLSLFDNPDETIAYCRDIRQRASKPNAEVYLDFDGVEQFTSDALLLIRAIMDECSNKATRHPAVFSGNLPHLESVATEFKASGFFRGIARPPKNLPEPQGTILKESKRVVHGTVAADLSRFAVRHARIGRSYAITSCRNLVELMNNTHEHAETGSAGTTRKSPQPSSRWFASVYCREGVAYFNFLDFGMGIMGSAPVRRTGLKLQRALGLPIKSKELLTEVFNGRAGSSTGKPGRGRGLPSMRRDARASKLLRMGVLTSSVIGTVADLQFRTIAESFRGTAFHWQVREED